MREEEYMAMCNEGMYIRRQYERKMTGRGVNNRMKCPLSKKRYRYKRYKQRGSDVDHAVRKEIRARLQRRVAGVFAVFQQSQKKKKLWCSVTFSAECFISSVPPAAETLVLNNLP